jgi:hypothetical protein
MSLPPHICGEGKKYYDELPIVGKALDFTDFNLYLFKDSMITTLTVRSEPVSLI